MNIQEAFNAGFDAVKHYVDAALGSLSKRVEAFEQRAVPKSVAGAVIDRDGNLVLTLSDGSAQSLGLVVGKDGVDAKGKDGEDGLGFDDLDVVYDGERHFVFRFSRGDQVKEFAFTVPLVLDRGVWAEGRPGGYAKGDGTTWSGSFWISQKDGNTERPEAGDSWRLAVKRGRDAKAPVKV